MSLQPEVKKYLFDAHVAAQRIATFVEGCALEDYQSNEMLKAAVERQFEIIGEALSQLGKLDSAAVTLVQDHAQIIAFRNLLIHRYAAVDDRLVWDVVQTKLEPLLERLKQLLDS